jgi:hypothetical protein
MGSFELNRCDPLGQDWKAGLLVLREFQPAHRKVDDKIEKFTAQSLRTLVLTRELEVDRHLRLDFNRLAVKQVGFIFPLFNSVRCSLCEERVTLESLYRCNVATLADGRHQVNRSFKMQMQCCTWIGRLHFLDD